MKKRMDNMHMPDDSLYTFLDETVGSAEVRRRRADKQYAELLNNWIAGKEELENSIKEERLSAEALYPLLRRYFSLDYEMRLEDSRTVYIQGWADCIRLLSLYGWIDSDC